jgi:signal transduction histidine kinase
MTTDLKKSQEQLLQQEKMASVGQLAAGAAHELNNPLAGILGYSQFALEKITKKTLKDLNEDDICAYTQYLKDIEHQSQRCKTIVQNLLKFARSSTKVPFEPLDLNSVLKDTLVFLSHQMDMNKIELIVNLADSPPEVMGNSNQIQQVFTNVIMNSIQAMPEGGKLAISSSKREKEDNLPERVEIVFTDTGHGIPEGNLNKIFEPFFTTKKVGEGTGLGLPVSYGIIKDHKGEISVESQVGKGTTFILWIPVFCIEERCEDKQEKEVLKMV